MSGDDLRQKNARLRDKIKEITDTHPELQDLLDEIALELGMHVEVGRHSSSGSMASCRSGRAIIERRPDLERFFED